MKRTFLLQIFFVALLSLNGLLAQDSPNDGVLYRGYPNEMLLSTFGYDSLIFELGAFENIKLSKNEAGVYVALPQSEAIARVVVKDLEGSYIDTLVFSVYNRPLPLIYLCGIEQGQSIESLCGTLELRYPQGVNLASKFKIVAWEISSPSMDLTSAGNGDEIQQAEKLEQQLTANSELTVLISYIDEFNVVRKTRGVWTFINN